MVNSKKLSAFLVPVCIVVIVDQLSKYFVRTTPSLHNWDIISGWLAFHYTQNPGMALGMKWAPTEVISLIAIIATIGILAYVIYNLNSANTGYLICMGLIIGGAFGNIIDRLVMAKIQHYGGILQGHVVDFIHFDLVISGHPVFPYIFNMADVSISTAIIAMLLFNKRIMPQSSVPDKEEAISDESAVNINKHPQEED